MRGFVALQPLIVLVNGMPPRLTNGVRVGARGRCGRHPAAPGDLRWLLGLELIVLLAHTRVVNATHDLLPGTCGGDDRNRLSGRSSLSSEHPGNLVGHLIGVTEEFEGVHAQVVPTESTQQLWPQTQRLAQT